MAIQYVSAGAVNYSASGAISAAFPGGGQAGDLLVLIVAAKPTTANVGTFSTPSGWTLVRYAWGTALATGGPAGTGTGGYGTTLGADTGNTNLALWTKVADGSESGTQAIDVTGSNIAWAQMLRFRGDGATYLLGRGVGWDKTGDSTVSSGLIDNWGQDGPIAAGGYVLATMAIPTDVATPGQFSGYSLANLGGDVAIGTWEEVSEPDSSLGNDIGGFVAVAPVATGASSSSPWPLFAATADGTTTNVRGPIIVLSINDDTVGLAAAQQMGDFAQTADVVTQVSLLHFVIYPSALAAPSAAQVKAGQDATGAPAAAGGVADARSTTGEQVFAVATGLTPDTSYRVAFVWSGVGGDSNVAVSSPFSTLSDAVSLSAAQGVGGFGQAASLAVQDPVLASVDQQVGSVSQAASLAVVAELSAAQDVGAFAQVAEARPVAGMTAAQQVGPFAHAAALAVTDVATLTVSKPVGQFGQAAAIAAYAGASASQEVADFGQSVDATVLAGVSVAQQVGVFDQAAAVTTSSAASLAAAQDVGAFVQAAAAEADARVSVSQQLGHFGQSSTITTQDAASLATEQQVGSFNQSVTLGSVAGIASVQPVSAFDQAAALDAEIAAQVAEQVGQFLQQVLVAVRDAGGAGLPASVVFAMPPDGAAFSMPPDGVSFSLPADVAGMELSE